MSLCSLILTTTRTSQLSRSRRTIFNGKRLPTTGSPQQEPYRRSPPTYPSAEGPGCATGRTENPQYTGSYVKGIGTMHKSNLVPVTDDEQAKSIARMRR